MRQRTCGAIAGSRASAGGANRWTGTRRQRWQSCTRPPRASSSAAASSLRFVPPYPDVGDLRNRLGQAAAESALREGVAAAAKVSPFSWSARRSATTLLDAFKSANQVLQACDLRQLAGLLKRQPGLRAPFFIDDLAQLAQVCDGCSWQ